MLFIISLALSLLVIAAGLFLLAKAKEGLGKFFKVMSWILIGCGILITLLSLQMAVFRFIAQRTSGFSPDKDVMFFNKDMPPGGDKCVEKFCSKDGNMKIMVIKGDDDEFEGEGQEKEIVKVVTDTVKIEKKVTR
jgi:hypothetical protein